VIFGKLRKGASDSEVPVWRKRFEVRFWRKVRQTRLLLCS